MSEPADDPTLWRKRAEDARAQAARMLDEETKATLIAIAQSYEQLAALAEKRDSHPLQSN